MLIIRVEGKPYEKPLNSGKVLRLQDALIIRPEGRPFPVDVVVPRNRPDGYADGEVLTASPSCFRVNDYGGLAFGKYVDLIPVRESLELLKKAGIK